jgi:hypothetical protein
VSESSGEAHFIIALPPSGIPKKHMGIIKGIREQYGVAHVNIYQTKNFFRTCVGKYPNGRNRYIRTFIWMEVSSQPLEFRESPDWPLLK